MDMGRRVLQEDEDCLRSRAFSARNWTLWAVMVSRAEFSVGTFFVSGSEFSHFVTVKTLDLANIII
ncbi:hypothetical protein EPI10_031246 [Gossypium australe]|uniref:Uncharacterized protein n=1 Tax=Gossypium australe TaxID=47621 RepID=A0A5B6WZQ4_9ROSI|nr:hypothetical protein EPI10_031246 [Gossypium australe]